MAGTHHNGMVSPWSACNKRQSTHATYPFELLCACRVAQLSADAISIDFVHLSRTLNAVFVQKKVILGLNM